MGDDSRRTKGTGTVDRLPSGRWRGRASLVLADGTRKRISVTESTERAAERALRKALEQAEHGQAPSTLTVAQWLDQWHAQHAPGLRPRTADYYAGMVRLHIAPYVGRVRLDRLTPADVTRWLQRLRADGRTDSLVKKAYGTLRTAMADAYRAGLVPGNVTDRVQPPRAQKTEQPWLTPQQLGRLLAWADQQPDPRIRVRAHLAAHGLRHGELLGVAWTDVDLDRRTLTVRQQLLRQQYRHGPACGCTIGTTRPRACPQRTGGLVLSAPKSRAGHRALPITPGLVAALRAWRKQQTAERLRVGSQWRDTDGLVLTAALGQPCDPRRDWDDWHHMLEAAGLPKVGTHAARRGAITALAMAGVPVKVAQAVAGHSTVALTMDVYARTTDDATRVAADAWERLGS